MEKKTRGFWTTLMLVLYILGGIGSLFTPLTNKTTAQMFPELALSNGMVVFSIISGIILLVITIGMFMWKKMAVYALAVYQPVCFLIGLIATPVFSWLTVVSGIIGIVIAYLIVFSLLKKIKYNEEVENSMNV
ncbi:MULTISPECIES: hypothetical protein [unclassified Clostridium]|uniref:hypothetical protein n=1 Tax=unclassified Clostridium TaxID=2614128 RepID=UPI0032167B4E